MSLGERYECLEFLARGNMGVLYRALDRRLGREVALKQILGGESEEERGRFLREAEAIARLSHPHIVAVHDYGESEGHPWMASSSSAARPWLRWSSGKAPCRRVGSAPWGPPSRTP